MNKIFTFLSVLFLLSSVYALPPQNAKLKTVDKIGKGIAVDYPGDKGIETHPSVVFTESFEAASMEEIMKNWSGNMGGKDHRLSLDLIAGPDGKPGNSLKMTIIRGKGGDGSEIKKIFDKGYEQLFFRFYVKFAKDYGFNHHFTSMGGDMNPTPWHVGRAGRKPTEHFSSTIDLFTHNVNQGPAYPPPGYWFFYSYWPEMKSWQTLEGNPDGRPNPYYGNNFIPQKPVVAKRGEWQCVEIMIRLNSTPDKTDGAHAFWIDGELVGHWDPEEQNPVKGYWIRENFRHNPDHNDAKPFDGIKWRTYEDMEKFEKFKINIVKLQNYVSENSWKQADKYAENNPGFIINLKEATVWKDNLVVATEYIGPLAPAN
jgi:hypothetical protein